MSAASPEMNIDEANALRNSIARLGQLVPIVTWHGEVIDGRKRLAACRSLGVEPRFLAIPDEATASDFAEALNLLRTQYTVGQRAAYATKLATLQWGHRPSSSHEGIPSSDKTLGDAAKTVGVHRQAVVDAKRVRRSADPAVIEAVERGEITLHSAMQIAKHVPREEQSAKLKDVIRSRGPKRYTTKDTLGIAQRPGPKRDPARILARIVENAGGLLLPLTEYRDAPLPDDTATRIAWRKQLTSIIQSLVRLRKRLK